MLRARAGGGPGSQKVTRVARFQEKTEKWTSLEMWKIRKCGDPGRTLTRVACHVD